MSKRIGLPLIEEVGRPRIMPKTLPLPEPVPQEVPEKEKTPVKVGAPVEDLIHRVATLLGVSDAWVAGKILDIADRISAILDVGEKRKSTTAKTL